MLTVLSTALNHIEEADWLTEPLGELGVWFARVLGSDTATALAAVSALNATEVPGGGYDGVPDEAHSAAWVTDAIVANVEAGRVPEDSSFRDAAVRWGS